MIILFQKEYQLKGLATKDTLQLNLLQITTPTKEKLRIEEQNL